MLRRFGGVAAVLWLAGVAVVYFAPGLGPGLERLAGSSLPGMPGGAGPPFEAILRIALAGAIFAAAWTLGHLLLGRARSLGRGVSFHGRLEGGLTAVALGLGGLSLLALALSPLGLLRPAVLVAAVALLALGAAAHLVRHPPPLPSLPGSALQWTSLALLLLAGAFALLGALAPEVEYDALWYHLELPDRYLAAGSLVDDRCQYPAVYPGGTELLFAYGLALEGPVVAKLVHLGFGVLLVLATYQLAARVVSRRLALVACVIVAATPTVLWEASTTYVELATAFFLAMSLMWLLRYVDDRSYASLLLTALFGGFALSTKTLALIALLPLVLLVVFAPAGRRTMERMRDGGLFAVVSMLPALPWLVRAELEAGNPVFPSLYGLFGADPDRWTQASDAGLDGFLDRFGYRDGLLEYLALPWDATMHAAAFGGSLGVLYLMLVPIGLLGRPGRRLAVIAAFALGYLALWASPLSSLQLRFLVPVAAPLAVLAAAGLGRALRLASQLDRRLAPALGAFVLGIAVLSLPPFLRMHERDRSGYLTHVLREVPADVVTGAETRQAYLTRRLPAYGALSSLNRVAARKDRVIAVTDPFLDLYAAPRLAPDSASCLQSAGASAPGAGAEYRALRRLGVRYLLVQSDIRRKQATLGLSRSPDRSPYLELVHSDPRARIYRLRQLRLAVR